MPLTPFGRFASIFRWLPLWLVTLALGRPAVAVEPANPRLAVVISIDQFRYDYLERFAPYFGAGGFQRLLAGGTNFTDCHYRHGVTKTAPGHATILSGVHANVHGIVGNEWVDRSNWQVVESVEDSSFPLVGARPDSARPAKTGRSPLRFLATTVGDQLKLRFGNRSHVFSVAHKDRAAILLGGKLADSVYWMDEGRFVTSTYYRGQPPAWVAAFNAGGRVEQCFGQTWDRLLDPAVYDAVQGPDDAPGENSGFGFSRTMPKKVDGGAAQLGPKFYEAFETTPADSEIVADFAIQALTEEKLGHHPDADLLCVGFSQIDKIGHAYGPDSHEMMDSVVRLDRVLARLFDAVDRTVGLANCLIVLTADHGSSPLPERVQALRPAIAAGRLDTTAADRAVTTGLEKAFGPAPAGDFWAVRDNGGYHLRPSVLAAKQVRAADAAQVVKQALLGRPEIAGADTADEVLAMGVEDDSPAARTRRSYFPGRSPNVVFVLKPYFIDKPGTGTNHGTPYDFDTHVPLLWFGRGIPAGRRTERVGVDQLAPTLTALLGVPPPPQAVGHVLF